MRKTLALLALVAFPACGGGGSGTGPSTTPAAPQPTPVPTHAGTYTGTMNYTSTGIGGPGLPVTGTTTVTHNGGTTLSFSNLHLTHPAGLDTIFGMGTATLDATDHFAGVSSYTSSGCGVQAVQISGWFSGDFMNLTVTLTPSSPSCSPSDVRGEIKR